MDNFALNIAGVQDLVENKTNKLLQSNVPEEGVESEKFDILELKLDDEELLKLRDEWEGRYAPYEARMKPLFKRNLESYLGKKKDGQWLVDTGPIAANLQFEAEETFLSAALAKNPEPYVFADNTPEGNAVSSSVKIMLQFHASELLMRRKLAQVVRQWSIYHLGVLKPGWNKKINDVDIENRKIQDFIFDPDGYVDVYGDFTSHLGERITVTAEKLIELYPKHKEYITLLVEGKLGTECVYTEWWTNEYCFVSFKEKVLDKFKNPYFNYEEPMEGPTGQPVVDEVGKPEMTKARNHFAFSKKPYIFLSVYSLQEQPHDITGLIEQNIPNQNRIARQTDQIDTNIASSNNGYAFSEDNFNQETGKQASNARKMGNPILIPSGGPIDKAILALPAQTIPGDFFTSLENHKNDLRTSWGVQGITSQPQDEDQTARGMILNQAHDTTRIGGGVGDVIEQVANNAFNWLVQLYYVFYDEQHFAAVMGKAKAVEYETLSQDNLDRQLIVGVSPDSMKPKDDITNMNLAQALFDKKVIGPKTLLKMVDFPDPDESAADGMLYMMNPQEYFQLNFPEYAQRLMQMQQQNMMTGSPLPGGQPGQEGQPGQAPEQITEPQEKDPAVDPASAALAEV